MTLAEQKGSESAVSLNPGHSQQESKAGASARFLISRFAWIQARRDYSCSSTDRGWPLEAFRSRSAKPSLAQQLPESAAHGHQGCVHWPSTALCPTRNSNCRCTVVAAGKWSRLASSAGRRSVSQGATRAARNDKSYSSSSSAAGGRGPGRQRRRRGRQRRRRGKPEQAAAGTAAQQTEAAAATASEAAAAHGPSTVTACFSRPNMK
jgi:hypothetical protein